MRSFCAAVTLTESRSVSFVPLGRPSRFINLKGGLDGCLVIPDHIVAEVLTYEVTFAIFLSH